MGTILTVAKGRRQLVGRWPFRDLPHLYTLVTWLILMALTGVLGLLLGRLSRGVSWLP